MGGGGNRGEWKGGVLCRLELSLFEDLAHDDECKAEHAVVRKRRNTAVAEPDVALFERALQQQAALGLSFARLATRLRDAVVILKQFVDGVAFGGGRYILRH